MVDTDYPLLFWLSRAFEPGLRVLELGGSLGHLFYRLETRAPFPDDARWAIAELPHAVELGHEIAERKGERRLSFIDSAVIADAGPCDLFVTAGTLQYMETGLPSILSGLDTLPSEVLVHNTPMHATREWWTRQNLGGGRGAIPDLLAGQAGGGHGRPRVPPDGIVGP
jgi:putative methyltransferase (TIGR04325 family)